MDSIEEEDKEVSRDLGTWIDKPFFEDLLSNSLEEEIKVKHIKVAAALAPGENYGSNIYRTKVIYTSERSKFNQARYLMIKVLPESKGTSDLIESLGAFDTEILFYTSILPAMNALSDKYFPSGTGTIIAPGTYLTSRKNTIVMDDLSKAGYKTVNRHEKLDYSHCLVALDSLARFHALSLKLNEEKPELIAEVQTRLFAEEHRDFFAQFIDEAPIVLANEMKGWREYEDSEELAEKLMQVTPFLWEKGAKLEGADGKLKVLNHGDPWVNNIMYQYDSEGSISAAKFVDFQALKFTCPAMDLTYFLITSPQLKILKLHFHNFISKYYHALKADLDTMNVSLDYTLEQLHEDMRDFAVFGVAVLSSFSAAVLAPVNSGLTEDGGLVSDDENAPSMFLRVFRTKIYQNYAINALRLLDKVGYLEDAVKRMQYVEDEVSAKKGTKSERAVSAHDRQMLARIKSAMRGAYRKFVEIF